MRALGLALLAISTAGCLAPGDPVLVDRESSAPYVQRTIPGNNDLFPRDGELRITFSEPMDELSLKPGISLFSGQTQVGLDIVIPAPGAVPVPVQPAAPYTVRARPSDGLLAGGATYTLVLNTLLADRAGIPLATEVQVTFFTEQ